MLLIKQYLIPEMYIYPQRFHPIDGIWHSKNMAIEVKCKTSFYPEVYITKEKYKTLMEYRNCRYINLMVGLTGREFVYSWNLKKLPEPEWHWKLNPDASNELYTGNRWMWMGYLDIKYAKQITDIIFPK